MEENSRFKIIPNLINESQARFQMEKLINDNRLPFITEELHLLSSENIISEIMGTDNDYAKTVYLYLNNLYPRWQKPEQALAHKNKYLECSK